MNNFKNICAGVLCATTILSTGYAQANDKMNKQLPGEMRMNHTIVKPAPSDVTADFVKNAAIGNMFEIESSKLALQRTKKNSVRKLAQHIINDHTKSGQQLKAVADNRLIPTSLDDKHQKMLYELSAAPNASFDNLYIKAQEKAHKEAIELFHNYTVYGKDSRLKDFAKKTLPTLKEHKDKVMAERTEPKKPKSRM